MIDLKFILFDLAQDIPSAQRRIDREIERLKQAIRLRDAELETARRVREKLTEQRNEAHYDGQTGPDFANKYIAEDDAEIAELERKDGV